MKHPATAVVIGASRGIGLAITRALLTDKNSERVIATHRNPDSATVLLSLNDARLQHFKLDVTVQSSLEQFASSLQAQGIAPDLVVHCAGILHETDASSGIVVQPEKSLQQCQADALLRLFEVNSIAPLMLARELIPIMPKRQPTHFAVLSAMVGSIADNRLGGWYGYRAAKSALNQFMRTLAIECRRTHPSMCITSIHPGTTDTDLSKPFQSNVKPGKLYSTAQTAERILQVVRSGEPAESGRFVNWDGSTIPW